MNRLYSQTFRLLVVGVALAASLAAQPTFAHTSTVPTTVAMAWVFDSHIPSAEKAQDEVADNVGYVWAASNAETAGGTATHDLYISWEQGFCPNNGLSHGTLALSCPGDNGPPSYQWLQKNHPDWILWQVDKQGHPTQIAQNPGDPGPIVDFTNPAVQEYWFDTWIKPAMQAGYDGISWDHSIPYNTFAAAGYYNSQHQFVRQYSGATEDPKFAAKQATALGQLLAMARTINPKANFTSSISDFCNYPQQSDWWLPLKYIHTVFDEAGYTNWGDQKYPWITATSAPDCSNRWLAHTDAFIRLQKMGKSLVLDNEIPMSLAPNETKTNPRVRALMQWALANYLLVKYSHTYFWFGAEQHYGYATVLQPEELINLGLPKGDMSYQQHVYVRTYAAGMALVNPNPHKSWTYSLPAGKYKTLYGANVDKATLGPHSGLVLESR